MLKVTLKIYGAFFPASESCRAAVEVTGREALGHEDGPWLFLEDDLLRLSFEGQYFPMEELVSALHGHLPAEAAGKLDILDIEAWTLTRHEHREGVWSSSTRGLNHVMDFSGH